MQKLIGTNDSANTISFNVSDTQSVGLLPNDPLDTFVNDEYVDAAIAAMASGGMTAWRATQVDPGEVYQSGRLDVTLAAGTVADLGSANGLRGVRTVYVTTSGAAVLGGLAGGADGREVDVVFVGNGGNVLNTFNVSHMAGGGTPATSRLFVPNLGLNLALGPVARFRYHGGAGLWYAV